MSGEAQHNFRLAAVHEARPKDFTSAVTRALNYIADGRIYQANLSREWCTTIGDGVDGSDIYASLCAANPAPFAGIAAWGDIEVISSSPERLLRVRNGHASTRPIAGTRPRSDDDVTDHSL